MATSVICPDLPGIASTRSTAAMACSRGNRGLASFDHLPSQQVEPRQAWHTPGTDQQQPPDVSPIFHRHDHTYPPTLLASHLIPIFASPLPYPILILIVVHSLPSSLFIPADQPWTATVLLYLTRLTLSCIEVSRLYRQSRVSPSPVSKTARPPLESKLRSSSTKAPSPVLAAPLRYLPLNNNKHDFGIIVCQRFQ